MRMLSPAWMPPDEESVAEKTSRFVRRKPMRIALAHRVWKKEKRMVVREPESQFLPAPAGVHAAVCVDEVDMGMVPNRFDPESGPVHTVRLVWQIGEDMKDGKPFLIKKDYRASLHEKAALRGDLECWRGKPFTFDELVGFDLEQIIGAPCMLNIIHKSGRKGGVFANIAAIMPIAKGMVKLAPRDYVRMKDRPVTEAITQKPYQRQPIHQTPPEQQPPFSDGIGDDDIPF